MRLWFGVVLCLFATIWAVGCRKPMTPNADLNQPPETWITAAPMDTITEKDPQGRPIPIDPGNHRIPVRFHLYWAGSDIDGSVGGYYYAVTETTAVPEPGSTDVPPLPGPKPQDYRYTTKTDTTFIFNVTEGAPDRQHAFFIYAVDNQGKPDPTPARFAFIAVDRFPPTPIFDWAYALGTVWMPQPGGGVAPVRDYKPITDISDPRHVLLRDSCAVNASLHFKWHASLGVAGSFVAKYCYKLDDPLFTCGPASGDSVFYNMPGQPTLSPGGKVFTLRAVDGAGGARDSTRRVWMNYAPDTWWSGPDLNDPQLTQVRDQNGDIRYIDLSGLPVENWPGISPMSADSVKVMPFDRAKRHTFFEIWNHRLYAHAEGDTVHMNSWVAFFNGGYDKDSKYKVHVKPNDPFLTDPKRIPQIGLENLPVLNPADENGSPVAFRSTVKIKTDPNGSASDFAQSFPYPIFDPASVFRSPRIAGYWPMFVSGKAYALARAEDGDGLYEYRVDDPRRWADAVDGGYGTYEENLYRDRILTFYVNKSPFFRYGEGGFRPDTTGAGHNVFSGHSLDLYLPADDVDPYPADPSKRPTQIGVPANESDKVLRYKVTVFGTNTSGRDTSWIYTPSGIPVAQGGSPYWYSFPSPPTNPLSLPSYFAVGPIRIRVELCDCVDCEHSNGEGRCISRDFDATLSSSPQPSILHVSPSSDRGHR